ncbi:MAG: FAD-binding oxidoreductase [Rhodobacter sp.]|nr:FAD-binding oxidoreductase [Rhodobacter sp.]
MASVDVTVMGAGIFGLATAFECARRGARVRVVDRAGVAAGSSGGVVGALAPHVPENWNAKKAFQLESLMMAETFWAAVDGLSGLSSGYARLGRIQPVAMGGMDLAQARAAGADALWRGFASWRVMSAEEAGTWAPAAASGHLIWDTLSARLHPKRACESLAAAVSVLGGVVEVGDIAPEGRVVWATGIDGLLMLNAASGKPVGSGIKGQALVLDHDARGLPQIFADGVHFVPHEDGTVAVGSTSERDYASAAGTDGLLEALHRTAVGLVPALADARVLARWAGVRPRARSRAPVLGGWPGRPGHFVANGGFKIGFGIAPKVAEVMADLVLGGRDAIPDGFRVEDNL